MSYTPSYQYIPPASFHVLTRLYDALCFVVGLGASFRRRILVATPVKSDEHIVDVGCGTGIFMREAFKKEPSITILGVDPDRAALAIAKRRLTRYGRHAELIEDFAESLPVAESSIDACYSTLAFHHMPDEIKRVAIKEMYRVLKPGGRAVITDFGPSKSWWVRAILFFERREYLDGNFRGFIPRFLDEAGFHNILVTLRKFPHIETVVAEKKRGA